MSGITILAGVFVIHALVAGRLDRLSITAPMVFVAAGGILGPDGARLLKVSFSSETTLAITEITLALLLFADASTVRLRDVEGDASLPSRLLFIGLPLTVALGAGLAYLMEPSFRWAAAALVATILAPTDALGLAVVTNPAVPGRIRRALNVKSGLNDGLATRFVTLFLAKVVSEESSANEGWMAAALTQIGLAVVAAPVLGLGGGWLVGQARSLGWTSAMSEQLAVLALALLAYTGSVAMGGNGFVAAFLGGLLFGRAATKGSLEGLVEFSETVALFMSFFVWTLFGALFVGPVLAGQKSWAAIGYVVLSLTVVRMLPVTLSLFGLGMQWRTWLFMGWFGPRGLASVVFTLVALEDLESGSAQGNPLVQVATWTILLSVMAQGVTAGFLAPRYGARMGSLDDVPELSSALESRMRQRSLTRHRSRSGGQRQPGWRARMTAPRATVLR
jgi:sodium/hydrogen antiporter